MSAKQTSRYAAKQGRKSQLYGPGCCGHKLTPDRMKSIREANGTWGKPGTRESRRSYHHA